MKRNTVLVLCVIASLLVLTELSLRVAGKVYLRGFYERNKPSDDCVPIVCLGESSTAGLWVEWRLAYPKQLEDKLSARYGKKFTAIVPPHVGQNTSQMSNRINDYLRRYHPPLVIIMAGYNNIGVLGESHIVKYLDRDNYATMRARMLIFLDNFRVFKLFRLSMINIRSAWKKQSREYLDRNPEYLWGHPELGDFNEEWTGAIYKGNEPAYPKMWRDDCGAIIDAAKKSGAAVVFMDYHINPNYLTAVDYRELAAAHGAVFVCNSKEFEPVIREGRAQEYLLWDNWHPNGKGYAIIADNVFRRIVKDDLLGLNHHR